eukprot:1158696-Pelagomonas_calceolata.AAC.13
MHTHTQEHIHTSLPLQVQSELAALAPKAPTAPAAAEEGGDGTAAMDTDAPAPAPSEPAQPPADAPGVLGTNPHHIQIGQEPKKKARVSCGECAAVARECASGHCCRLQCSALHAALCNSSDPGPKFLLGHCQASPAAVCGARLCSFSDCPQLCKQTLDDGKEAGKIARHAAWHIQERRPKLC